MMFAPNNKEWLNIIEDDDGNLYGSYAGLKKSFINDVVEFLQSGDYEQAQIVSEALIDLEEFREGNDILKVGECAMSPSGVSIVRLVAKTDEN